MAAANYPPLKQYEFKDEHTRIPFDPNIRHRLPTVPNHVMYSYLYGYAPLTEAMSSYVAVNHKGTTYHLFNAKRMPIGRIAVLISQYIRGKHRPGYETNNFKNADKCVVVNMANPMMTGNKKTQKVYRHHTGYSGGLKEIPFKQMLEKSPEQILIHAVLGMLPKNDLRHDMIKQNVIIYREPFHNMTNILPQFTELLPRDINEDLGFDKIGPDNTVVKYMSGKELPEEYKDIPLEIDDSIGIPATYREKTHAETPRNKRLLLASHRAEVEIGRKLKHMRR